MFFLLYGLGYAIGVSKVVPWDIKTNYSVLIENVFFGLSTAYLIVRWGGHLPQKTTRD